MVIPTMPSSVRKPMASNKPVYLTTRRAEIGIVQSTQQMTLPQAVVHLDVTAAEQIILILARLCGGRRLISYNPAMLNQHRQIEIYLGKVIHGALPADLPHPTAMATLSTRAQQQAQFRTPWIFS